MKTKDKGTLRHMKQKSDKKKLTIRMLMGVVMGVINGFFGSGGGIIAVDSLERSGMEQEKAHATSLLVILPLSIISGIVYLMNGSVTFDGEAWWLLGGGAIGGLIGAFLLGKLKSIWINGIFTLLILASGIRMVF